MKTGLALFLSAAITIAASAPQPALAQNASNTQQALALYQQVVSGARKIDSLSPDERAQVLLVARVMRSSCSSNSHKCQSACEATNQLDSAARDLAQCASRHDYSESCDAQFNEVRDAHDDLENAVAATDGDCE